MSAAAYLEANGNIVLIGTQEAQRSRSQLLLVEVCQI